jgi:hypothetical protein
MFLEEYMNFKILHYLRRCGVILVQSFESHMPPPGQIRVKALSQVIGVIHILSELVLFGTA